MIGSTNSIWDINIKYEQLVNYTMLYDGSLGESGENGANVCLENTGGYYTNFGINTGYFEVAPINFLSNEINIELTATNKRQFSSFATKNPINLSEYNKAILQAKISMGGSDPINHTYGSALLNLNSQSWSADTTIVNLFRKAGGTSIEDAKIKNNQKAFYIADISQFSNDAYFTCNFGREENGLSEISYYEMFFTKPDDYRTLAEKAGITVASIEDLLINSSTLLSNEDAVEFMIKQCTGDFMASAVQSETFLSALNNSPYKTKILANEHWAKFLNMVI